MAASRGYLRRFKPGFILRSTAIVVPTGLLGFGVLQLFAGSERFYRELVMPLVHRLTDAETAHRLAIRLARSGRFLPWFGGMYQKYPELKTKVLGLQFDNPIGMAAGFDKDAECLVGLSKAGLGFVEVGSVTPLPQDGNEKPRVWRLLEDRAVINRYGFNSAGNGPVMVRLRNFWQDKQKLEGEKVERKGKGRRTAVVGVNLGKNKNAEDPKLDYSIGLTHLGPFADYVVINVSSPNTPGLRNLQNKTELANLLSYLKTTLSRLEGQTPKLLVKIAPDLSDDEKKDIADVCLDEKHGVSGIVVGNTTTSRSPSLRSEFASMPGGLSGRPLRDLSTKCVGDMYRLTRAKLTIVGSGGVFSGRDAYEKIRAGASLVQIYTALVYEGFPVIGKVKRELADCLTEDGFSSVAEAVGADHPHVGLALNLEEEQQNKNGNSSLLGKILSLTWLR